MAGGPGKTDVALPHLAHDPLGFALLARAVLTQELPRIDAVLMAVVPGKPDAVLAHRLNFSGARQCLEHGQRARDWFQRIAGLAAVLLAFFLTQRARAGIAQEHKRVRAA